MGDRRQSPWRGGRCPAPARRISSGDRPSHRPAGGGAPDRSAPLPSVFAVRLRPDRDGVAPDAETGLHRTWPPVRRAADVETADGEPAAGAVQRLDHRGLRRAAPAHDRGAVPGGSHRGDSQRHRGRPIPVARRSTAGAPGARHPPGGVCRGLGGPAGSGEGFCDPARRVRDRAPAVAPGAAADRGRRPRARLDHPARQAARFLEGAVDLLGYRADSRFVIAAADVDLRTARSARASRSQ